MQFLRQVKVQTVFTCLLWASSEQYRLNKRQLNAHVGCFRLEMQFAYRYAYSFVRVGSGEVWDVYAHDRKFVHVHPPRRCLNVLKLC
jgi:hypothetical protein